MKRLAILGASGHGKVLAEIAELSGWCEIDFFDDSWPEKKALGPWEITGTTDCLLQSVTDFDGVIVAIGNNQIRSEKQTNLENAGFRLATLIHPAAVISKFSVIGDGSVVMANAVINPFAAIGKGCIINTASTVDHDCVLADCVHVSPGANLAGAVTVGIGSWIGIGASVKQLVEIGNNVVVGAGAAVTKNIEHNLTVAGVPAVAIH